MSRDVCSATNCSRHLDHGELAEWLKDLATIKPQNWSDLIFSKAAKIQKAVAERGGKEQSSEHVRSFVEAHCPWMEGTKHRQIFEAAVRRLLLDCQSIPSATEQKPARDPNVKYPRLFYWEETENCWCPADGLEVENIIDTHIFLADGEETEIRFKRQDMTEAEFDAIPEG
jgi:hypothetical protein